MGSVCERDENRWKAGFYHTQNVRSELHIIALRRRLINDCIYATCVVLGTCYIYITSVCPGPSPAIIERMKLGLLADELLGSGLDRDKV